MDDLSIGMKRSPSRADWKSRYEPVQLKRVDHQWPSRLATFLLILSAFIIFCIVPVKSQSVNTAGGAGLQRFSRAHFAFSLDLYSALASQNPANGSDGDVGNVLFSPYSVSTVLAMMFLGAGPGSPTALQLRSALHLNNFSFSEVHSSYKTVLNKLADPYYSQVLAAANGIFQQEGLFISDKYKRALSEFYSTAFHPVDFARPQTISDSINQWAKNLTEGKISSFLHKPSVIDPSTRIILANALAFRSQWLFRFDPALTFDKGLFYTTSKRRYT